MRQLFLNYFQEGFFSNILNYFPEDFLVVIDESHVSIPQIGGMYAGDQSRKRTLVDFGFRLPSALDNRPLSFEEWEKLVPNAIFVSATPGDYELRKSGGVVVEQLIRPTGLWIRRSKSVPLKGKWTICLERSMSEPSEMSVFW